MTPTGLIDDTGRCAAAASRVPPGASLVALRRPAAWCLLAALLAPLAGCSDAPPPRFRLNLVQHYAKGNDPLAIPDDVQGEERQARVEEIQRNQQTIADLLEAVFGTPDEPIAVRIEHEVDGGPPINIGLDADKLQVAAGKIRVDNIGKGRGLYRRHCAHCHGLTGDGKGPTAMFLNPYPRDYREGKFKFKSTDATAKPTSVNTFITRPDGTREEVPSDLKRILLEGIAGTMMPSFRTLPGDELDALVEYVKYLSVRGEMELKLLEEVGSLIAGQKLDTSRRAIIDGMYKDLALSWYEAPQAIINPKQPPPEGISLGESIAEGRRLFYDKNKGNCFSCHGTEALGDGQIEYDDWNKELAKLFEEPEAKRNLMHLGAFHIQKLPPRNLRLGVFRGGRRPLDIYRRITGGINGAPMPGNKTLTSDEVWHLVRYVKHLAYEPASRGGGDPQSITRPRQ